MFWTDDNVEALRRLWGEGHTAQAIAGTLGCTRNAVIGRAHRDKLSPRQSPIKPRKNFFDPPRRQCEWLDGDNPYIQCGETRPPGQPYCAAHMKRAYRGKPARRAA